MSKSNELCSKSHRGEPLVSTTTKHKIVANVSPNTILSPVLNDQMNALNDLLEYDDDLDAFDSYKMHSQEEATGNDGSDELDGENGGVPLSVELAQSLLGSSVRVEGSDGGVSCPSNSTTSKKEFVKGSELFLRLRDTNCDIEFIDDDKFVDGVVVVDEEQYEHAGSVSRENSCESSAAFQQCAVEIDNEQILFEGRFAMVVNENKYILI